MPEQTPGHDGVRLVIDNMNRVDPKPESASGAEPEAPPATGGGKGWKGAKNGRGIAFKPLEPDCPVKALGKKGKDYFYQNADGEFITLKYNEHNNNAVMMLFGNQLPYVHETWPRFGNGGINGWNGQACRESLMSACSSAGLFEAGELARGTGAWRGEAGQLILHCGNKLIVVEAQEPGANGALIEAVKPGSYDEKFYPGLPPLRGPSAPEDSRPGPGGPGAEALALLKSWHWAWPEMGPYVMLGWIGIALMGAALSFRSLVWVTGDYGTGKSTLQREFLKPLLGSRLLQTSNATPAGIWQKQGIGSRAVAIDEGEPDEGGGRRMRDMLKFAREAATGGLVVRGGSDHEGTSFQAQCPFLFSSILMPPMEPQDRSRFVVLELKPLAEKPGGAKPLGLNPEGMKRIGDGLLGRVVGEWWRWQTTFDAYAIGMMGHGLDKRGADLWGTLLASADILLHAQEGLDARVAAWALRARDVSTQMTESRLDAFRECINTMMTYVPDGGVRKGLKQTVEMLLRQVREPRQQALLNFVNTDDYARADDVYSEAEQVLALVQIRVLHKATLRDEGGEPIEETMVAVGNQGQGIARLFDKTKWMGGVWVQALRRYPYARKAKQRIGGAPLPCTLLPLADVLGLSERETYAPVG